MIHKILLGHDGSASADQAYGFAVDLAKRYGAELHVLVVARPPEFGDEVEAEAAIEDAQRRYHHVLSALRVRLANDGLSAQAQLVVGHPAEQLVRYAEQHRIDHIVVGHRGHTLFERWLIGSIARQVVAYAPCAVTIVRQSSPSPA
ncbi:Nucleotide-binding universal stress protein, UspA family [Dyella jiangningensis]|jgi:nucleotide-binding universal stress UspA family protein|uniref:universal stress protein n=1 Tax=Pseudomonadota TaxID=1224 RepID=UPI000884EE7B|nr:MULTISPECIES: universal stress protein [Pseudomonadota]PXV59708.1 nucleotide-binding universal stress UspA family protein [Dyella sp. AtDHG13]SDJ26239.1 Nucleotide-binding universal stress protein, UspA family [Dyella jiangningensis]